MHQEKRMAREAIIEEVTYKLLSEKGYHACSMLSIARKAKASNETMYKWYGDKVGLIRTLVVRNAAEVSNLLGAHIKSGDPGIATLRSVSPVLLKVLVSERAIALNRAAATDHTGEVGRALSKAGRESVVPLLCEVFKAARERSEFYFDDVNDAVELYLGLLVGDLQIRRVIRSAPEPKLKFINQRSKLAVDRIHQLLASAQQE